MTRQPIAERAYSALVALYPRQFRDEYRADMVLVFREQCRDEPTWRVCLRSITDLALTVPNQHLETQMHHRNPTPVTTLGYLTVSLAGVLLAFVGGTTPLTMIIGAITALCAGTLATLTWRRAAPFRESNLTGQWWKFVIAGPTLLGAVILAAGFGVEAWFLGLAVVFIAISCVLIGFALALANLVGHHTPSPT
jgi:hypothetical protein